MNDTRSCQHRVVPGRVRARGNGEQAKYFLVRHEMERGTTFFENPDTTRKIKARHGVQTSSCPVVPGHENDTSTTLARVRERPARLKERLRTRSYQ